MVSYFVPRGRYLLKAGNVRKALQQEQQLQPKQQQQQHGNWSMLRHFRQSSTQSAAKPKQSTEAQRVRPTTTTAVTAQQIQLRRNILARWTGFLLRWAPMGLCVFGALEWQLHKYRSDVNVPATASEFQSMVYCSLPLRIMSRCWGWLASCYMPNMMRPYIYGWYSQMFNVNISEAQYPDYNHYNSMAEFFTRPLREGARIIDAKAPLVSPADGRVLHFGSASDADSRIEQVKGVNYNIEDFLGPLESKDSTASYAKALKQQRDGNTELYQCVIYLAPGDYHRFHSPAAWEPTVRRHFSGELLSVSPTVASWLPGLFCLNERVLYMGKWQHGFFSYTAVGATNVGSVEIYMDEELKTNRWTGFNVGAHPPSTYAYDERQLQQVAQKFDKGDLIGQFNMGSTIVLLFEAPKNFQFDIEAGQKISVGQALGHLV